jgi:mRNA interferase MazF
VNSLPVRGEVWWCDLPGVGRRPVVVLSRDTAIPAYRRTVVSPCTTTIRGLPSEVVLDPDEDPIPRRSAANLDSIQNVPVDVLVERIGRLGAERMQQVCAALAIAVDCRA